MTDETIDAGAGRAKVKLVLKIDAVIALLAGLGMGGLSLFAALGVWFGWWSFREGFGYLQISNAWANWVAGIAAIVGISIFVASRMLSLQGMKRFGFLALVGAASSALAYFIPLSFAPPEGTPAIHDITTNTLEVPRFVAIAPLRAEAPNSMIYGAGEGMTAERLRQLQLEAYPDIQPQRFTESEEVVFQRALAAVETMGWELVQAAPNVGRIEATDTTFWFRFKDDIVIYISRSGDETILNARSLSRVGVSDVGKNAARLREFFSLLR